MPERSGPPIRYDERQMALVLKLASERQARVSTATEADGYTLEEMERIASEAGISPQAVREAALALQDDDQGALARLLGGPTSFQFERELAGGLAPAQVTDLVDTLQWVSGKQGETHEEGESLTWKHHVEEGPLTLVQIARREGKTRIRLVGRYEDPATWTLILGGAGATALSTLIWTGLDASFLPGAAIVVGTFGAMWVAARAFWRGVARRTERRLRRIVERLAEHANQLTVGVDDGS